MNCSRWTAPSALALNRLNGRATTHQLARSPLGPFSRTSSRTATTFQPVKHSCKMPKQERARLDRDGKAHCSQTETGRQCFCETPPFLHDALLSFWPPMVMAVHGKGCPHAMPRMASGGISKACRNWRPRFQFLKSQHSRTAPPPDKGG